MTHSVSIAAVGDLQLGDSPTTVGYGFYSRYHGTDLEPLFAATRPALAGADVLFANLETTLVPPPAGETRRMALQMRGEPSFASALRRVGITVVNVANNHSVQHGDETFHATVAAVRAAGVSVCGVRGTGAWASEPVMLRDGSVGIVGYCLRPRQWGSAVPPYAEGTADQICADVHRLRASGAMAVVSLHWGEEFVPEPSRDEVDLGHAIIDAGANLILGHHPHVVRPVERYADGVIVHSLGNFMGDMVWYAPFRRGAVFTCSVSPSGVTDAQMRYTRMRDDYAPELTGEAPATPLPSTGIRGMEASAYTDAIAATWRSQRIASYTAALRNIARVPLPILIQMATQTTRNKLVGMADRLFGRARTEP